MLLGTWRGQIPEVETVMRLSAGGVVAGTTVLRNVAGPDCITTLQYDGTWRIPMTGTLEMQLNDGTALTTSCSDPDNNGTSAQRGSLTILNYVLEGDSLTTTVEGSSFAPTVYRRDTP